MTVDANRNKRVTDVLFAEKPPGLALMAAAAAGGSCRNQQGNIIAAALTKINDGTKGAELT